MDNSLNFTCPAIDCHYESTLSNMLRHLCNCVNIKTLLVDHNAIELNDLSEHFVMEEQETQLLYDPDKVSFVAFNQMFGIPICTLHQTPLRLDINEDSNGIITSITYGTNHFKQHHYSEKDHQDWLSTYLLQKYNENQDLFKKELEMAASKRLELSSVSNPIAAIDGLKVVDGLQCCLCKAPKYYSKVLSNSAKNSNKTVYLWRHYKSVHGDFFENNQFSINDIIIKSPEVLLQTLYDVTFPVFLTRLKTDDAVNDLLDSIFPITSNSSLSSPSINTASPQPDIVKNSGLESKYRFHAFCVELDQDQLTFGHREKLLSPLTNPMNELLLETLSIYSNQCQVDIKDFGINGRKELENIRTLEKSSIERYMNVWNRFISFLIQASLEVNQYSLWLYGLENDVIQKAKTIFEHLHNSATNQVGSILNEKVLYI